MDDTISKFTSLVSSDFSTKLELSGRTIINQVNLYKYMVLCDLKSESRQCHQYS